MIVSLLKKIDFAQKDKARGRQFLPSHVITVGDYANLFLRNASYFRFGILLGRGRDVGR